jgi:hypothetical protein
MPNDTLEQFFRAYHFAWLFWTGVTLGFTGLLLLNHAIRPIWGSTVLRLLEAGSRMLPVMLLGFIPIAVAAFTQHLFPWADPAKVNGNTEAAHILQWKAPYLNPVFFTIRGVLFFLIWIFWTQKMIASAAREDRTGDYREGQMRANWAAPGLVVHVLLITLAMTDWAMSLDPVWFSTIYPIWFMVGHGLCAMSFMIIFVMNRIGESPWREVVTPSIRRDFGNMMLMLTMVWAYFTLSQFLIIWSGNLPEETHYFHTRMSPQWNPIGTVVVIFQFFVPFLLLLSGRTKRTPGLLKGVALMAIITHAVNVFWTVIPSYVSKAGHVQTPLEALPWNLGLLAVVGIVWYLLFRSFLGRGNLLPTYDPRLRVGEEAHQHA